MSECLFVGRHLYEAYFWLSSHVIFPRMDDHGSDDGQVKRRMDTLLLRLLKTPPQSRAELADQVRRAKQERKNYFGLRSAGESRGRLLRLASA